MFGRDRIRTTLFAGVVFGVVACGDAELPEEEPVVGSTTTVDYGPPPVDDPAVICGSKVDHIEAAQRLHPQHRPVYLVEQDRFSTLADETATGCEPPGL